MPGDDTSSLSDRAQEILRRADSRLAGPAEPAAATDVRPPDVRDVGELLDTVEAGIGAARAHLVTLSASLARVAQEIEAIDRERGAAATAGTAHPAARFLAIEMAVAGDPREDAERRLREQFPGLDLGPILDDAFGAGA